MTWVSFTQNTRTSSIPAALRASCPPRKPGTWHVDQVGGERAGKTDDDRLLAREALGHVHLRGREGALLEGHVGELIADGDHLASFAARGDERETTRASDAQASCGLK
jgi:hypothetical protein